MIAKTAKEVREPGAYEWHDEQGARYIGFVLANARDALYGCFVRSDGEVRSFFLIDGDGHFAEGSFYGPMLACEFAPNSDMATRKHGGDMDGDRNPARRTSSLKLFVGNYDGRHRRGVVAWTKKDAKDLLGITETTYRNFFSVVEHSDEVHRVLWESPEQVFQMPMLAVDGGPGWSPIKTPRLR